jgi:hypothetical protein
MHDLHRCHLLQAESGAILPTIPLCKTIVFIATAWQ